MKDGTRRNLSVWQYRVRAALWVIAGVVSFPLGWANSVALVWIASLYANVATDLSGAAAADNRELIKLLKEVRAGQLEILRRLPPADVTEAR